MLVATPLGIDAQSNKRRGTRLIVFFFLLLCLSFAQHTVEFNEIADTTKFSVDSGLLLAKVCSWIAKRKKENRKVRCEIVKTKM